MKTAEDIILYLIPDAKNLMTARQFENACGAVKGYAKQLLEEYTNRIVDNGKCLHTGYGGYAINKKSITSQLPKFLKEKGI
jgi:hypothetical protein